MLSRDYPHQTCSIARSLEVVGERWTLLILREALLGAVHFDDFVRGLGIATNTLTSRLERLTAEGLLQREPIEGRHRFEYRMTDKGRELGPALIALMHWGDRHYPEPEGPPRLTVHEGCGGRASLQLRCDACDGLVGADDLGLPDGPALARA